MTGPRPTRGRRRALGQHFLHDPAAVRRIVALVEPTPRDLVLEIGPGQGALTGRLAGTAGRVVAVEVDPVLAAGLRERFAEASHVDIVTGDALGFDYGSLPDRRPAPDGRVLVVGNLPYSVGTAILHALVDAAPGLVARAPLEMAIMLQREVAERVAAGPGSRVYAALSVLTQVSCEARLAFTVPPGAFRPPPLVESAVLHLRGRARPPVPIADPAGFRATVRAAFARRRKTLANALATGLGRPVEEVRARLVGAGLDPGRRAETLTLAEFARLAAALG